MKGGRQLVSFGCRDWDLVCDWTKRPEYVFLEWQPRLIRSFGRGLKKVVVVDSSAYVIPVNSVPWILLTLFYFQTQAFNTPTTSGSSNLRI